MATISTTGARRRKSQSVFGSGKFRLRSYLAAVACTTALSTAATAAPVVAQEQPAAVASNPSDDVLKQLADAMSSGSVSSLAGALADVQGQIANLESLIGEQREAVNKALVDLQDSRTELKQAQRGTQTAHSQVEAAQKAVEAAQAKLDELSRASYRRANTASAVRSAAGGDARADELARQSFLRTRAEDQQAVVDQLEQERTEKANKEAQLKQVEQLAQDREQRASQAEADARALLETSQSSIGEIVARRDALVKQQAAAQTALDQARGADSQGSGAAVETPTPAAPTSRSDAADATVSPEQSAAQQTSADSEAAAATSTPAVQETVAAANDSAAPVRESESAGTEEAGAAPAAAVADAVQGSSVAGLPEVSGEQLAAAGTAAVGVFGTAAALVAASQPEHTDLDGVEAGSSESDLKAIQAVLTAVGDAMGATTAGDTAGQLGDVLETLDTAGTVTKKASSALVAQGTNAQIEAVIARAESQIGVPYAWGGGNASGPTKGIHDGGVADSYGDYNKVGFDCSGLTLYSFAAAGISLPHYTGYQYNMGTKVDPSEMQRGDLIFYGPGGSQHVAIYLGDGTMIEAPESGSTVQITPVRYSGMSPQVVRLIG